jgi:cytochrome c oxidase assembly factor CtaG
VSPTLAALLWSWNPRPDVVLVLASFGVAYVLGWRRLRAQGPTVVPPWRLALYLGGLGAVGLALLSPIDALGSLLFFGHMTQHELLTTVAPPLLLLGNPLPAILWALPRRARQVAQRLLVPGSLVRRAIRLLTLPWMAWPLYVITLWAWHHPAAYGLSLRSGLVHDVQHLSFFATAVLFWWPVIDPAPHLHGYIHHALRVAYIVPAAFQSQALGVIFAFLARRALYPHYEAVPRLWGLTPLQDQSLAGQLMMQVEGMTYLLTILLLVARMLAREDRIIRWQEERGLDP